MLNAKVISVLLVASFSGPLATAEPNLRSAQSPATLIPNWHVVTQDVVCGGQPDGEAAYRELSRRGIRTIVSVDGAAPDLASARQHGLRTVHIPVGYDGVSQHARLSLVRVMKECESPIYVHCHHGQHRAPVASVIACMSTGKISVDESLEVLRQAGTSPRYAGLWNSVSEFRPPPADAEFPTLVESASVTSLAAAMSDMDRTFDKLNVLHQTDRVETNATKMDSATELAVLLEESMREMNRLDLSAYHHGIVKRLRQSELMAIALRKAIRQGEVNEMTERLLEIQQSCQDCHRRHRD